MRHFLVIGFAGNSRSEPGEHLYLGTDKTEATRVVNAVSEKSPRRELFELATPWIRRRFIKPQEEPKEEPKEQSEGKAKKGKTSGKQEK